MTKLTGVEGGGAEVVPQHDHRNISLIISPCKDSLSDVFPIFLFVKWRGERERGEERKREKEEGKKGGREEGRKEGRKQPTA